MNRADEERVFNYPFPHRTGALEPPPEWAWLRHECPVAQVRLPSGDRAMLLSRHADVRKGVSDERFSRELANLGASRVSKTTTAFDQKSLASSGESHQRWKRVVGRWFTAKRMAEMRPKITAMAEQLIDEMTLQERPADLIKHVGSPLPLLVICDLLGVPISDSGKFESWSDTFTSFTRYGQNEIDAAQTEFAAYIAAHVAAKRTTPADDLISDLIKVTDAKDGRLSAAEWQLTARALLVAGKETTAKMIGKMLGMLLEDRRLWRQLLADPALIPSAVEECLRMDPTGQIGLPRYLLEDTEVGGVILPGGSTVLCVLAAANRDETVFDHAEEIDLRRSPNPHLTFGSGPYACIGQALARTELQVVLETLLKRVPALELDMAPHALRRTTGLLIDGLEELPVRW